MSRKYLIFPEKFPRFPDSRNKFVFLPKQPLLELSPPVLLHKCFFTADFSPENTSLTSSVKSSTSPALQKPIHQRSFHFMQMARDCVITQLAIILQCIQLQLMRQEVSYSCIPSNDYGNGLTRTITVIVHCKFAIYQK